MQNSSQELFPPIASRLDVREVKTESVSVLSRYFGMKFLSLEIRLKKMENLDVWPLIEKKRGAFDTQFHLIVVSIFLKTCERSWR